MGQGVIAGSELKAITKSFTASVLASTSAGKAITKTLNAVVSVTASVIKATAKVLMDSALVAVSVWKEGKRTLSTVASVAATTIRKTAKSLTASPGVTSSITRLVKKGLSAVVALASTFTTYRIQGAEVFQKALSATATTSAYMVRLVKKVMVGGVAIALSFTSAPEKIEAIQKALSATVTAGSTMTKGVVKHLASQVIIATSAIRKISKALVASVPTSTVVKKAIKITRWAIASSQGKANKKIPKVLQTIVRPIASFLARNLYPVFFTSDFLGEFSIESEFNAEFEVTSGLMAEHEYISELLGAGGAGVTIENQDFNMYAGDSRILNFTVTLPVGTSLTTAPTMVWSLGRSGTELTKSLEMGCVVTGDTTCTVTINPADTTTLVGGYWHKLKMTDDGGKESTLARGNVVITNP